jgi:general secretion pathway protein A
MGPEEVEPYMLHRLNVVGWQGNPHFTPDAYRAMYEGSDGVPRRLNQLAGRVMLFGSIEQLDVIDGDSVEAVIADIAGDVPMPRNAAAPSGSPILVPMPAPATVAEPIPEPDPAAIEPMREEKMAATAPVEPRRPLPIFHVPPPTEPLPIRSARQIDVPIVEARTMEPPANDLLIEELAEDPVIETVPVTALPDASAPETVPENDALAQRIALLEGRIEEQEAALRRVLTLLVDWVEGEAAPDAVSLRYAAAH